MADKVIMVIDDDVGVAQLCERVLKRAGFEVIAVTEPQQGISVLQQAQADLLLVDIRMPQMDGFMVMERARALQPDLAVVIMTGYGTLETAIQALRQGANELLLKPFAGTVELVESVKRALDEQEHRREVARLQAIRPLIQITQSLFVETDPRVVVELTLKAVCEHLPCDHAGFYQRKAETRLLQLTAALGRPLPEEESSPEAGPVGRSDAWGSPLRVTAGGEEDPKLQEVMHKSGMESVMCAPVLRNEHSHSVLLAGRERGEAVFSEADFELFVMIARQAAIALENAHLYAELRDYLHQVEESQRALIQAEKMAAIGRLTASIAHEINNPLQAMRNCLHLVGREELPLEKRKMFLQMAESELERLMQTVGQMLDFYRPSALQRELSDVRALIERVITLLHKQMKKGQVEVHTDFAQDLPQVFVVSNQIQQVFFNILLNAMEAMGEGGEIFIEARPCPEGVEVIFEDTGPGLDSEVRSHLFEPFTSTKEKGTGLGLSVSYNILEAHGGKLEFVDDRGRGACFRVVLPRMEA